MKRYMNVGDRAVITISHSEACMHMKIAGQILETELVRPNAVQIYKGGEVFSSPVTTGEAGYYWDSEKKQHYVYDETPCYHCSKRTMDDLVTDYELHQDGFYCSQNCLIEEYKLVEALNDISSNLTQEG